MALRVCCWVCADRKLGDSEVEVTEDVVVLVCGVRELMDRAHVGRLDSRRVAIVYVFCDVSTGAAVTLEHAIPPLVRLT